MSMQKITSLALVLAAGFLGSALYHWAVSPAPALADGATRPSSELRATRFVLVDEAGKVRAMIGQFPLTWPKGFEKPRELPDMTGMIIYDAEGKPAGQFGTAGPMSRLELASPVGWASFGVSDTGSGLGFWCPEETLRFGLGNTKAGNAGFVLKDLQGRDRLGVGMPPTAGVSIHLKDEKGEDVWSAP